MKRLNILSIRYISRNCNILWGGKEWARFHLIGGEKLERCEYDYLSRADCRLYADGSGIGVTGFCGWVWVGDVFEEIVGSKYEA